MKSFFEKQTEISNDDRTSLHEVLTKFTSITKFLLVLSEYLDHGGNDTIGAELLADFAVMYADHEKDLVKETINKNLN